MKDHIVDEVRRIREEHAAAFGYDIDAIYADLKRLEKESKAPRVSFGPRLLKAFSGSISQQPEAQKS
jgi:hypothetical protein